MKKRGGKRSVKKIDADLDEELERYEPSDSDDGFDDEERDLLNNAVGRRTSKGEEEVLKVYSSSDDSDDEVEVEGEDNDGEESEDEEDKELYGGGVGSDMDSDIEGKGDEDDGLPDSKAWGSDRKQYYDTDYVDKDFLDFDDEEAAIEEEKEADAIQRRLLAHLEGTDFTLGLLDTVEDKKKEADKKKSVPVKFGFDEEKVEVDLSKLSKDEFIELMKRKHPEIFLIIEECKVRMKYLGDKIAPILELVNKNLLERTKVIDFIETLHQITLHYAVNVLFFIHLKDIGVNDLDKPVLRRLNGLSLLIKEMDLLRRSIDPEIDIILEKAANGEDLNCHKEKLEEPAPKNRKERRKRKLELLKKKEELDKMVAENKRKLILAQRDKSFEETLAKRAKKDNKPVVYSEESSESDNEQAEDNEPEVRGLSVEEKRSVTFEMLKNKGLTPRRKKENRNPRVKHRNKFKKAIVRRRGQVRVPRKELKKYGGEISGINHMVSKSIRIK